MKLTILVDTKEYALTEVYQSHLHEVLMKMHEVEYIELKNLSSKPKHDNVFVCARFRNSVRHVAEISKWTDGRKTIFQDYDPWVFLEDNTQFSRGYETIADNCKNSSFAVPNLYWSKVIENRTNKKVHVFRLGVPPHHCDPIPQLWQNRQNRLEFRGSSYPSRERSFKKLSQFIPVNWDRNLIRPYSSFLDFLSNTRIWAQDESDPIVVDGKEHCRNWLWPKAIEVISRGCFLVRDRHTESKFYEVDKLPTVFLYENVSEAATLLETIEKMSDEEKNERIRISVDWINQQYYYERIGKDVENWFNE